MNHFRKLIMMLTEHTMRSGSNLDSLPDSHPLFGDRTAHPTPANDTPAPTDDTPAAESSQPTDQE